MTDLQPAANETAADAGRLAWSHLAAVAAAAVAAYSNTFDVPFQFDDGRSIVGNAAVRDLGAFFSAPWNAERPLGQLTFALNGSLGGQSVLGYHLVNLAIHVAAAACVYFLTLLVARQVRPALAPPPRRVRLGALFASLLFALHPIQTQAVTYIVQRFTSLAALMYLGAILAYGHAVLDGAGRIRRLPYAGALLLAGGALLVKENAASLPMAIALWDLCFARGNWRARAARVLPFLAVTAAVALLILQPWSAMEKMTHDYALAAPGMGSSTRWTYLVTQSTVLIAYLRLLVLPIGQNLDYDFPIRSSLLDPAVVQSLAILVLVFALPAAAAWRARARSGLARILLFAIGWFFVTLSVESSLLPLSDVIVEHRLYLPLAGLAAALGCALAVLLDGLGHRRNLLVAGLGVWLAALGGAAWARNQLWRDPVALWSDAVAKSQLKCRPRVWLAQQYIARQDYGSAIPILKAATTTPRPDAQAWTNLGACYVATGRPRLGAEAYQRGYAMLDWRVGEAREVIARAITTLQEADAACADLEREVRERTRVVEARQRLAACRRDRGDYASAVEQWQRLLADDPSDAVSAYNIADGFARMLEPRLAAGAFRRFLEVAGGRFEPQRRLAEQWLASHPDAGDGGDAARHATP